MRRRGKVLGQALAAGLALAASLGAQGTGRLLFNPDDADAAAVAASVRVLVPAHFPRLATRTVRLVPFESDDTYFRTDVRRRDLLKSSENRVYNLYFNPAAFRGPAVPAAALDAILTHELVHLEGYTSLSGLALTTLAARYLASDGYRVRYERATDLATLELGKADGLKAYRHWIYPTLSPDDLAAKRRIYYTPDEIDAWVQTQAGGERATP